MVRSNLQSPEELRGVLLGLLRRTRERVERVNERLQAVQRRFDGPGSNVEETQRRLGTAIATVSHR